MRDARSYVFLEQALDAILGPEVLDQAGAVSAAGPSNDTLRMRIRRAAELYFGLDILSSQDIGLRFALDAVGDPEPARWDELAARPLRNV